jgi:hypothetical protein
VERDTTPMKIWRMRFACWIPNATNTHSEYVIHVAFPLQQWWHELASMLRYAYIGCLSSFCYSRSKISGSITLTVYSVATDRDAVNRLSGSDRP